MSRQSRFQFISISLFFILPLGNLGCSQQKENLDSSVASLDERYVDKDEINIISLKPQELKISYPSKPVNYNTIQVSQNRMALDFPKDQVAGRIIANFTFTPEKNGYLIWYGLIPNHKNCEVEGEATFFLSLNPDKEAGTVMFQSEPIEVYANQPYKVTGELENSGNCKEVSIRFLIFFKTDSTLEGLPRVINGSGQEGENMGEVSISQLETSTDTFVCDIKKGAALSFGSSSRRLKFNPGAGTVSLETENNSTAIYGDGKHCGKQPLVGKPECASTRSSEEGLFHQNFSCRFFNNIVSNGDLFFRVGSNPLGKFTCKVNRKRRYDFDLENCSVLTTGQN